MKTGPARQPGVTLTIRCAEDIGHVPVNPHRMSQVINNLGKNSLDALKNNGDGGCITVSGELAAGFQVYPL